MKIERETFLDWLDDYCAGTLDAARRDAVERWLEEHPEDRLEVRRHQALRGAFRELRSVAAPDGLRTAVLKGLKVGSAAKEIRESEETAAVLPVHPGERETKRASRWGWLLGRRPVVVRLFQAAALAAICVGAWQLARYAREEAGSGRGGAFQVARAGDEKKIPPAATFQDKHEAGGLTAEPNAELTARGELAKDLDALEVQGTARKPDSTESRGALSFGGFAAATPTPAQAPLENMESTGAVPERGRYTTLNGALLAEAPASSERLRSIASAAPGSSAVPAAPAAPAAAPASAQPQAFYVQKKGATILQGREEQALTLEQALKPEQAPLPFDSGERFAPRAPTEREVPPPEAATAPSSVAEGAPAKLSAKFVEQQRSPDSSDTTKEQLPSPYGAVADVPQAGAIGGPILPTPTPSAQVMEEAAPFVSGGKSSLSMNSSGVLGDRMSAGVYRAAANREAAFTADINWLKETIQTRGGRVTETASGDVPVIRATMPSSSALDKVLFDARGRGWVAHVSETKLEARKTQEPVIVALDRSEFLGRGDLRRAGALYGDTREEVPVTSTTSAKHAVSASASDFQEAKILNDDLAAKEGLEKAFAPAARAPRTNAPGYPSEAGRVMPGIEQAETSATRTLGWKEKAAPEASVGYGVMMKVPVQPGVGPAGQAGAAATTTPSVPPVSEPQRVLLEVKFTD